MDRETGRARASPALAGGGKKVRGGEEKRMMRWGEEKRGREREISRGGGGKVSGHRNREREGRRERDLMSISAISMRKYF